MYRILLADDEGLMLESLKSIINSAFPGECEIETAKTGRIVIEKTYSFHPDIIFLDIYMPGINGIQAMKEIRQFNQDALIYVISAYNKFDYAQEAISMAVEKYLTKPVTRRTVTGILEEAFQKVDKNRIERSNLLKIQEKLEIVVPVIETGFVSAVLFQGDSRQGGAYRELLDISEENGYVMVLEFGKELVDGKMSSPVTTSLHVQEVSSQIRDEIKAYFSCAVGAVLSNRIAVIVPAREEMLSYEERSRIVEQAHLLVKELEESVELCFRIGIGRIYSTERLEKSYREAMYALSAGNLDVSHYADLKQAGEYDEAYPYELESSLFSMLQKGRKDEMLQRANAFFDWMILHDPEDMNNIRLKVLEYIIWGERCAFEESSVNYSFSGRKNYLDHALQCTGFEELRSFLLEKLSNSCDAICIAKQQKSESAVKKIQTYIREHYAEDITLDEMSREVNISPYYFSKMFKEEAGENFIDYLTRIRIDQAKQLLEDNSLSVKEIGIRCGYADPNYFSRNFKKQTDQTPSEYRINLLKQK